MARIGNEHRDIIVGVKVKVGLVASGGIGVASLNIAIEAADALGLPVMAHLDRPPPSRMQFLSRFRPGDMLTQCSRPFPAAPTTADGRISDDVRVAKELGVIFCIGCGMGSFSWSVEEAMMAAGLPPDCILSDVHTMFEIGPAFEQLVTMSKFNIWVWSCWRSLVRSPLHRQTLWRGRRWADWLSAAAAIQRRSIFRTARFR